MVLLKMVQAGGGVGTSSYSTCTIRRDTFTHVQFPINQGELEFSFRYIPTTVNSRTYKVNLGAEQYLQLFVNNNWEIMDIEELNTTNDDGTGLIRIMI